MLKCGQFALVGGQAVAPVGVAAGSAQERDAARRAVHEPAVVEVPELQQLIRYICKNGFEHHAAMSASHCAQVFQEALETYLRWDVYRP